MQGRNVRRYSEDVRRVGRCKVSDKEMFDWRNVGGISIEL